MKQLRETLWEKVGIIRDRDGLSDAVSELGQLSIQEPVPIERSSHEAHNMLTVARLIATSALARAESRGAHYRTDVPYKDSSTAPRHSFVSRGATVFFAQDLPVGFAAKSASQQK